MTSSPTFEALGPTIPEPFHSVDPNAYLRPHLSVRGSHSKMLGKIDALTHDPKTGELKSLVVQHGLLRQRRTRVDVDHVKWVNQDSVILNVSQAAFKRLPAS